MQCAYSSYIMFLYVLSYPDLPGPNIVTYRTPWELARGIHLVLTLVVPGSLGGFFGSCANIQLPIPSELPESPCPFPTHSGSPFLAKMLLVCL